MTQKILVTIYDSASETYSVPHYFPARGAALRAFMDEIKKPDSDFHRYSEHFAMFMLGSYDQKTGLFDLLKVPELLGKAMDLKN